MATRHGTVAGYNQHYKDHIPVCDMCRQAKSVYDRRYKHAPENVRRSRQFAAAQGRARSRLVHLHPDEYARLFAEEKAKAGL